MMSQFFLIGSILYRVSADMPDFGCLTEEKTFNVGVYMRKDFLDTFKEDRPGESVTDYLRKVIEDEPAFWLKPQFNIKLYVHAFVTEETAQDEDVARTFETIKYDTEKTPDFLGKDGDLLLASGRKMAVWIVLYKRDPIVNTLATAMLKQFGETKGVLALGWEKKRSIEDNGYTVTHEFGHVLGLSHDKIQDSMMSEFSKSESSYPTLSFSPDGEVACGLKTCKFKNEDDAAKKEACDSLQNVGPEVEKGFAITEAPSTITDIPSTITDIPPSTITDIPTAISSTTSPVTVLEDAPEEGSDGEGSIPLWPFLVAGFFLLGIILGVVYYYCVYKKKEDPLPLSPVSMSQPQQWKRQDPIPQWKQRRPAGDRRKTVPPLVSPSIPSYMIPRETAKTPKRRSINDVRGRTPSIPSFMMSTSDEKLHTRFQGKKQKMGKIRKKKKKNE